MANGALESRLDAALEPDVPVQRVKPYVSVTTPWTRVLRGIPNVDMIRQRVVVGLLLETLLRVIVLRTALRNLFIDERVLFAGRVLHSLILRHHAQVQSLVAVVPVDRRTWRVVPLWKTDKRISSCLPRSSEVFRARFPRTRVSNSRLFGVSRLGMTRRLTQSTKRHSTVSTKTSTRECGFRRVSEVSISSAVGSKVLRWIDSEAIQSLRKSP